VRLGLQGYADIIDSIITDVSSMAVIFFDNIRIESGNTKPAIKDDMILKSEGHRSQGYR
jgi:transketolase N-terminal domain/subunit